jgi:thiamine pyrophosphate-dependent acetolactate synthase large subunit-like protein
VRGNQNGRNLNQAVCQGVGPADMESGMPNVLGAAAAFPGRQVISLAGDGDLAGFGRFHWHQTVT